MKPTTTNTEGFFKVLHELVDSDINGTFITLDKIEGNHGQEVDGNLFYQVEEEDEYNNKPRTYMIRFTLSETK